MTHGLRLAASARFKVKRTVRADEGGLGVLLGHRSSLRSTARRLAPLEAAGE